MGLAQVFGITPDLRQPLNFTEQLDNY